MKIEINLDIEAIVREAIRNNAPASNVIINAKSNNNKNSKGIAWEFASQPGRRRTTEEMALHDLELEKGRLLTPEEKGQAKAVVEMDETTENKVKEATIKKARINEIAAEGMAAASKELAEEKIEIHYEAETKKEKEEVESLSSQYPEATIPQVEDIGNVNSLFGKDG